jgi:hypothetical protein
MMQSSDFAGRVAATVRRNAQVSNKARDLFMSVISLDRSLAMGLLLKTVQRMR